MIEAIPLTILVLFAMTLLFGFLRMYFLWRRREDLAAGGQTVDEAALDAYRRNLTRRLALFVYAIPIAFVAVAIFVLSR